MPDLTDKRYQRKHSSLLESYLDNDTVLKVIEHLDSYSVINFLHAFPRFKNLAVIVTDHHKTQPLFFRIGGVERVHITDYTESQPVEIVDPTSPGHRTLAKPTLKVQGFSTSRPIRLFEFAWMETEEFAESILPVIPSQERLSRDQPFYFNATSFVFLCPNYYRDIRPMDALTRRLDEFTQAKWHVGCSPYFSEDCVIVNSFDFLYHADVEIELIKNLCLKDVPVVANLHLPELQRLSLIYHDTRAPVVRGIVAAKLTKLIVHYSHQVPQFSEMTIATAEQDQEHEGERMPLLNSNFYTPHDFYYGPDFEALDDLKVFELAHIGSMTKGTSVDVSSTGVDRLSYFNFVREFQIVHLFGVPDSFFRSADLFNMWKLRWDIVEQPQLEGLIVAPSLSNLSLVVRHDGISVPSFNLSNDLRMVWSCKTSHWHIMMLGLNVQILKLLNPDYNNGHSGFKVTDLCIYNSPSLLKRNQESVLEISRQDWTNVLKQLLHEPRHRYMESIELIGFKMPFLTARNLLGEDIQRAWRTQYSMRKVICRPVITDFESESEQLVALCASVDLSLTMLNRGAWNRSKPPENRQFIISPLVMKRS